MESDAIRTATYVPALYHLYSINIVHCPNVKVQYTRVRDLYRSYLSLININVMQCEATSNEYVPLVWRVINHTCYETIVPLFGAN